MGGPFNTVTLTMGHFTVGYGVSQLPLFYLRIADVEIWLPTPVPNSLPPAFDLPPP